MVWEIAVDDRDKFWTREFVAPATQVRLHLKDIGEVVDGDAPVAPKAETTSKVPVTTFTPPAPPATGRGSEKRVTPASDEGQGWPHKVNGRWKPLCEEFQVGRCSECAKGSVACPADSRYRHQCAVCLGFHPAVRCDGSGFAKAGGGDVPPPPPPPGGRGRGGYRGRGGKGGRGEGKGRGKNGKQ